MIKTYNEDLGENPCVAYLYKGLSDSGNLIIEKVGSHMNENLKEMFLSGQLYVYLDKNKEDDIQTFYDILPEIHDMAHPYDDTTSLFCYLTARNAGPYCFINGAGTSNETVDGCTETYTKMYVLSPINTVNVRDFIEAENKVEIEIKEEEFDTLFI